MRLAAMLYPSCVSAWRYLYRGAITVLFLALIYHQWQIIIAPVPLDLYEGTMLLITGIIAEGGNPYTLAYQPQAADVYPPLYNIIVAPLTSIFGNNFQLHRSVSAGFILLSISLVGLATWKRTGMIVHSCAAAVMAYAALLFYATPVSSTNAPAVFVFLVGLIVPWWCGFTRWSLLFALLCGLLAFYTKQYFVVGIAILCLYLFLYRSMRLGFGLGFVYAFCLLLSLWWVHRTSPYYLDNTLFAPSAAMSGLQNWHILLIQLHVFLTTYAGLLLIIVIYGVVVAWPGGFRRLAGAIGERAAIARRGWRGPLLSRHVDFMWFSLFWTSLVILVWLGRNPGNYMTYLFQLISPFLLVVGFSIAARLTGKLELAMPLILLSLYQSYAMLHKDFSTNLQNWNDVEAMVAGSDEILSTQMLLDMLLRQDKKVYQDGHTFYFPLASAKPGWLVKEREEERVANIWQSYVTMLYRKIERREFDLILVSPWEMRGIFARNPPPFEEVDGKTFLSRHYFVASKIKLSMTDRHGAGTYDILVWRPKKAGPGEN